MRTDPLGNSVKYEYSKIEQITAIIDPLGNESRYEYDLKQRLVRVHRHGVLREEYVYDVGDHFIEKRNGQGNVLFTNSVHENHFVETRILSSGGEHRFGYDVRGRITQASTDAHDVLLGYDDTGLRVRDVWDGHGVEHAHARTRTTTRVLGVFEHATHFEAGATQLGHADGSSTRVEHADTSLVKRRSGNGTTEVLQFNEAGQLEASLRYRRGPLGRQEARATRYAYSAEGDLLEVHDSEHGASRYELDAAHRLLSEHTPDGRHLFYAQDPAGNLVTHPASGRIDIGSGNRLLASLRETFEHDARHRLAARTRYLGAAREPDITHYHYDSFDMLVRIERHKPQLPEWLLRFEPQGPASSADAHVPDVQRWAAEYDALGRRLLTRWTTADGVEKTRRFYWDGDRLAAEVFPNGSLRIYQYATHHALIPLAFANYPSADAPPSSARIYHVFANPVGIPLSIEDHAGNSVWYARRIDPYGLVDIRPDATLEYNLRWPGHYFDPETGLHYNRYRYYDPKLGRYLQSDPIGHEGSPTNLYAYCPNPLVQVDVLGLAHPDKTSGDGSESGPHRTSGKEGTRPQTRLPGVSADERALAASSADTRAARAARKKVLQSFLGEHGREFNPKTKTYDKPTPKQIRDQLKGHDMSKPVKVGPPPRCPSPQYQWQRQGGFQGSYYTDQSAKPGDVGIANYARGSDGRYESKVQKPYAVDRGAPYLESTAAPCNDTWSVKGQSVPTQGGGVQRVIGDRSRAKPT